AFLSAALSNDSCCSAMSVESALVYGVCHPERAACNAVQRHAGRRREGAVCGRSSSYRSFTSRLDALALRIKRVQALVQEDIVWKTILLFANRDSSCPPFSFLSPAASTHRRMTSRLFGFLRVPRIRTR